MSRKLFIARGIILLANVILFIFCYFNYLYSISNSNLLFLSLITLFIIFIVSIIDIIKKRDHSNLDDKYNITFIISHMALMFIMLRGIFDPLILSNSYYTLWEDIQESRMLFVGNNLLYFVIINIGLILYRLTIKKNIKKEEKLL